MASQFQIFELITHAPNSLLERKETWPPFETREQAVERVENVIGRHSLSGFDDKVQTWWAITTDGHHLTFVVQAVNSEAAAPGPSAPVEPPIESALC